MSKPQTIARHCPKCHQYGELEYHPKNIACPHCKEKWGEAKNPEDPFDYCPVCECRQFYLSKDFNQFIGIMIMLVGIVLVPFTYGLSLPLFWLIDLVLFRRFPYIINCYRCGTEFRNFENKRNFKPFLHHIGLKYDKYR
tara:strand:+ start:62 stop:478 length:417 start_codon:yes stop_codon:yes gene_type:complete